MRACPFEPSHVTWDVRRSSRNLLLITNYLVFYSLLQEKPSIMSISDKPSYSTQLLQTASHQEQFSLYLSP